MKQSIYVTNLAQGKVLAQSVAAYLDTLPTVSSYYPPIAVMVKIDQYVYFGAKYFDDAKDDDLRARHYLLGRLHNTINKGRFGYQPRNKNIAYIAGGYTLPLSAGYGITEETIRDNPQFDQYHPFGVWFSLDCYPTEILVNDRTGLPYLEKLIGIIRL